MRKHDFSTAEAVIIPSHVTRKGNVWRSYQSTVRENIRRRPLSYTVALAVLWWHAPIGLAVLLQVETSKQSSEETSSWDLWFGRYVAKSAVCRGFFFSPRVFHNMRNWCATCKQYPLLYFNVKITEFLWNSSGVKNCRFLWWWAELMHKRQSHWPALTYYRPCFDFGESIRAKVDYIINIHEPSSLILSAF